VGRAMMLVETAAGHLQKRELAAAIGELQEAVSLSPDFTEAYYQLGLALRESAEVSHKAPSSKAGSNSAGPTKDMLTQAETAFRRVLQLDPNNASAYLQLGSLLESRGDIAQATSQFERAVHLAPGLTEAHLELGRMAKNARDWVTVVREVEAVLAWSPENAQAHYDLAAALKADGQLEQAARELRIAVKLNPGVASPR
jgi:Flp pilus assembly protein TadD